MIDRRPALIVRAKGVDDVIAAVAFARAHGLPISIRGGAHNVAGHAVGEAGLMIDLSAMRGVRVDPERRRALVEGGATWGDVDAATQPFGLAAPGGLISDTGVGGLTLSWRDRLAQERPWPVDRQPRLGRGGHGGWPPRAGERGRARGPAVGAQGRRRQLRCRHDLRVRASSGRPDGLLRRSGLPDRSGQRADPVLARVPCRQERPRRVAHRVLDDPGRPGITRKPPGASASTPWPPRSPAMPMRAKPCCSPCSAWARWSTDFSGQMAYRDLQQSVRHGHPVRPAPVLLEEPLPERPRRRRHRSDPRAERDTAVAQHAVLDLELRRRHGRGRRRRDGLRRPVHALHGLHRLDLEHAGRGRGQHRLDARLLGSIDPHSAHGRLYLNFAGLGEGNEDLVRRTFGDNFDRLAAVKRTYDPANVFRFNQNIRPAS